MAQGGIRRQSSQQSFQLPTSTSFASSQQQPPSSSAPHDGAYPGSRYAPAPGYHYGKSPAGLPTFATSPNSRQPATASTFLLAIANRLTHLYLLITATAISAVLLPLSIVLLPVTLLVASPLLIVVSATAYIIHALHTTWGLGPQMSFAARIAYATGKHVLGLARTLTTGWSAVSSTLAPYTPSWLLRRKEPEGSRSNFEDPEANPMLRQLQGGGGVRAVSQQDFYGRDDQPFVGHQNGSQVAGASGISRGDGLGMQSNAGPSIMNVQYLQEVGMSHHHAHQQQQQQPHHPHQRSLVHQRSREDFSMHMGGDGPSPFGSLSGRGGIHPFGSVSNRVAGGGILVNNTRTLGSTHAGSSSNGGYAQNVRWSLGSVSSLNSERRASYILTEKNGMGDMNDPRELSSSHPQNSYHLQHNAYDPSEPSDLESIVSMDTESVRGSIMDGIDRSDSAYDSDLYLGSGGLVGADSDSVISRGSSIRSTRSNGLPFRVTFRYLTPHDVTLIELCNSLFRIAAEGVMPPSPGGSIDEGAGGSLKSSDGAALMNQGNGNGEAGKTVEQTIRVERGRETGSSADHQVLVALRRDADPQEPILDDLIAFVEFFHAAGDPRHLRVEKLLVSARYENLGFGRRLLRELHRHRRVESVEVWSLWHAEPFYKSLGYNDVRSSATGERIAAEWGPLLLWMKPTSLMAPAGVAGATPVPVWQQLGVYAQQQQQQRALGLQQGQQGQANSQQQGGQQVQQQPSQQQPQQQFPIGVGRDGGQDSGLMGSGSVLGPVESHGA
ncbi:hypothetical protein HDU97_003718 [Phlyctochytrium planicorne]|nr:hypothetical protein HDU97_003718 [Phlyctochytrium planicorne]